MPEQAGVYTSKATLMCLWWDLHFLAYCLVDRCYIICVIRCHKLSYMTQATIYLYVSYCMKHFIRFYIQGITMACILKSSVGQLHMNTLDSNV
jgi:hypothetical protein